MLDDLFDLLFTVVTLFFCLFFINFVLSGNVEAKEEAALDNVNALNVEKALLHYLNYPVLIEDKEIKMRGLLLLAVNGDDEDLFEEKTEEYFEKRIMQGMVNIYNTKDYLEDEDFLFDFNNLDIFSGEETKATISLPNIENNEVPSITVVFTAKK